MAENNLAKVSKTKTLIVFILTIILGYALFIIPDLFFGITKINGGKKGINLLFMALFQFFSITVLLYVSLKLLKKDFKYIGLRFVNLKKDTLLGIGFGALWTLLQFTLLIPNTGGADRLDIKGMLDMYDGSITGLLSFIALGVIGGGITEELFNRGYFINVLKDVFKNPKTGLWFSAILSILLFALGHMPVSALDWLDILVPTIMYTLLFISTKRVTASIVAHGIYNMSAIILTYYMYAI
ncbi:CAAX amino terminal protease self- immunity [Mariniflexile rhizosphaerae]|uniref:CPBP family intramembrane glutamic endopeptidase n=1 Tax=unclassified Mariniflexile TaxID=2643887 RepID=UPI000CB6F02E|nr:CPBP family intramembrane glutamic endopeptidase [Mariniflexile sp. TRM1-10]AXP82579.1 CAAX amino terminal protease self- immunity [Mariniflexile sp. TRM1-10]PLB19588.1 MAG: Abortive infection protein [Flavobacteriaceae bacterium FS1-H7996/R]